MGILRRGGVLPEPRQIKHMAIEKTEGSKSQTRDKLMKLHAWPWVVAIAGTPCSGKTEWLLSLADALAKPEEPVFLSDLTEERSFLLDPAAAVQIKRQMTDVTPLLADNDFDTVSAYSLRPEIDRAITRRNGRVLLDVGINASGLRVLSSFRRDCAARGYDFHLVVNPFCPQTADTDNVRAMKLYAEELSKLSVTGLIANAFEDAVPDPGACARGAMSVFWIAQELDLPLLFALADEEIAETVSALLPDELPVWSIKRAFRSQKEDDDGGYRRD